jgi:hypothetical protein
LFDLGLLLWYLSKTLRAYSKKLDKIFEEIYVYDMFEVSSITTIKIYSPCDNVCSNFVADQACRYHEIFESILDFLLQEKYSWCWVETFKRLFSDNTLYTSYYT